MTQELYEVIFRGLQAKYPGQPIGPRWRSLCATLDGGEGSGNFGHEGRHGKVGGSGEGREKHHQQEKQMNSTNEIIQKIDFTKDNILPAISKEDAKMLGVKERPYLLKKSIGERNKVRHPDIDDEKAKEVLVKALYQRDKILQGTHENKPDYYHFAAFVDNHNYLALVDFTPRKEYNEIVHYYIMRKRDFVKMVQKIAEQGRKIWE